MKPSALIFAAGFAGWLFLTPGCTSMPDNRLTKNYSLVRTGMTEKEVIALLGFPKRTSPPVGWREPTVAGGASWQVEWGPEFDANVIRVDVTFDRDRRVVTKRMSTSLRTDSARKTKVPPNGPGEDGLPSINWDRNPPKD